MGWMDRWRSNRRRSTRDEGPGESRAEAVEAGLDPADMAAGDSVVPDDQRSQPVIREFFGPGYEAPPEVESRPADITERLRARSTGYNGPPVSCEVSDERLEERQTEALRLFREGLIEDARRQFDELLRLYVARGDKQGEAVCLANLGCAYRGQGDYAKAMYYFKRAQQIDTVLRDERGLLFDSLNLAGLYALRGDLAQALGTYEQAIDTARRLSLLDLELAARLEWSNTAVVQGDFTGALSGYKGLIQGADRDNPLRAMAIGRLGQLYHLLGEYAYASSCYRDALSLLGEPEGTDARVRVTCWYARLLGDVGADRAAWEALSSAAALVGLSVPMRPDVSPQTPPRSGRRGPQGAAHVLVLRTAGQLLAWHGAYTSALEYFRRAEALLGAKRNPAGHCALMLDMGHALLAQGRMGDAMDVARRVLTAKVKYPADQLDARLLWLEARIEAREIEDDEFVHHLGEARKSLERLQLPAALWRFDALGGLHSAGHGRLQSAHASFADALDILAQLADNARPIVPPARFYSRPDRLAVHANQLLVLERLGCSEEALGVASGLEGTAIEEVLAQRRERLVLEAAEKGP